MPKATNRWTQGDAPSEKKKHNKNIEELSVLKLKLINREVEWEAVKPEFETLWTLEHVPKMQSKPSQSRQKSFVTASSSPFAF
jgi:hypothetical protein